MTSIRHNASARRDPGDPRDAHLDAARDCIIENGWRRTTLTEIARRADVSRMTLYRAWGDMPTLLSDLMTREADALVASALDVDLADRSADGGAGAHQVLVEQCVAIIAALRRDEFFTSIVARDPELLLPYLLERPGRAQRHVLEMLEHSIREGQRVGGIRLGDPTAMARGMALTAHGFILSAQTMTDDRVAESALTDELRTLFTRMLRP